MAEQTQEQTQELSEQIEESLSNRRDDSNVYIASQWQLMWWRLRRHKLAMASLIILAGFYFISAFAEFFAYTHPLWADADIAEIPIQQVQWFDGLKFDPYVNPITSERSIATNFLRVYTKDESVKIRLNWFGQTPQPEGYVTGDYWGYEYNFLGFIPTTRHYLTPDEAYSDSPVMYWIGTDELGRDLWSRLMLATRVSMSIGLIAVAISIILGVVLGGISGFYGGWTDNIIQRIVEVLRSVPTIPLWMGLAAAVPRDWSVVKMYFAVTVIISLLGWTTLCREVRGRFLSLREEDFVMAAELAGAGRMRIILRHMVPSFSSHIIAAVTLSIPFIIIAETSLSYLGLGMREPGISWGTLLYQAQNITSVATRPWMLLPGVAVIVAVLAFNFLGDGLRDAADPYG